MTRICIPPRKRKTRCRVAPSHDQRIVEISLRSGSATSDRLRSRSASAAAADLGHVEEVHNRLLLLILDVLIPLRLRTSLPFSDSRTSMTHLGACLSPFEHSDPYRTCNFSLRTSENERTQSLQHTNRFQTESRDYSRATTLIRSPAHSDRRSPCRRISSLRCLLRIRSLGCSCDTT